MNVQNLWPLFLVPVWHNGSHMHCKSLAYASNLHGP